MIHVDPEIVIAVIAGAGILATFALWAALHIRRPASGPTADKGRITQCPYCGHMMRDRSSRKILLCPVCQSYLEVENVIQGKTK